MFCQESFDLKAFKGKGAAEGLLREVEGMSFLVWSEMRALAGESKSNSWPAYLQPHAYKNMAGLVACQAIHWRLRSSTSDPHVDWTHVQAVISRESLAIQRYFEQLNERMQDLNVLAAINRSTALHLLARLYGRTENGSALYERWVRNAQNTRNSLTGAKPQKGC